MAPPSPAPPASGIEAGSPELSHLSAGWGGWCPRSGGQVWLSLFPVLEAEAGGGGGSPPAWGGRVALLNSADSRGEGWRWPPHAPWRLHHPVSATSRRWGGSQLLHVSQNQEAAGARSCLRERVPLDPLPTLREWGLEGERRERTPSQPLAGSVGPSSSSFPSPVSAP